MNRTHYSTGEVARMMHLSSRKVCQLFDDGTIKGFKVPGSKTRRLLAASVMKVMLENMMPIPSVFTWIKCECDHAFHEHGNFTHKPHLYVCTHVDIDLLECKCESFRPRI